MANNSSFHVPVCYWVDGFHILVCFPHFKTGLPESLSSQGTDGASTVSKAISGVSPLAEQLLSTCKTVTDVYQHVIYFLSVEHNSYALSNRQAIYRTHSEE